MIDGLRRQLSGRGAGDVGFRRRDDGWAPRLRSLARAVVEAQRRKRSGDVATDYRNRCDTARNYQSVAGTQSPLTVLEEQNSYGESGLGSGAVEEAAWNRHWGVGQYCAKANDPVVGTVWD